MTEIIDLPEISPSDVSDDDLLLLFDNGAATQKSRKATRAHFLKDVVRTSGAHTVETLNATGSLNAPEGSIDHLEVSTGLTMGATVSKILIGSASITIPEAIASAQVSQTFAVVGCQVGDIVTLHAPTALPAGLLLRGVVTSSGVVTVYAYNATGSTIASAAYDLKALVVRASAA